MQFSVNAAKLKMAITAIRRIFRKEDLKPAVITASGERVTITGAPDNDIRWTAEFDADVIERGRGVVSPIPLHTVLRSIRSSCDLVVEAVAGEDDDAPGVLRLINGKSTYELEQTGTHRPPITEPETTQIGGVTTTAGALLRILLFASTAMGRGDVRQYLNGLYFDVAKGKGGKFAIVGTDGHRLAFGDVETDQDGDPPSVIMPTLQVTESIYILKAVSPDQPVGVTFSDTKVGQLVEVCSTTRAGVALSVTAPPYAGSFPDWRRLLPKKSAEWLYDVEIDRGEFVEAVKPMALHNPVNSTKFKPGIISASSDDDVSITMRGDDVTITERLPSADVEKWGPFPLAFNPRYLSDAVGSLTGDRMRLRAVSHEVGAIMSSTDGPGNVIVMPCRP